MEQLHHNPENEGVMTEYAGIKEAIHKLHQNKEVAPHVLGSIEMMFAGAKNWYDFVDYVDEDLHLDEKDTTRVFTLIQKFLDEELAPNEEKELKVFIARYDAAKHPLHGKKSSH